jgi:tetratricopeptide (TPR) repeat protein
MRKTIILIFLSAGLFGCGNQIQPVNQTANTNISAQRSSNQLTASSHSTEKSSSQNPANSSSSGGSPMGRPIDVSEMNAKIEEAEKNYKAKANDAKAKEELARAYFIRAFALTEAAQYRAALGDFRKGLKLKPDDEKAKQMHDQIIDIFKSIGREPPKEGEEPPPMPFNKS